MVHHEMVDGDYNIQRTVFADGTAVTVDFGKQKFEIVYGTEKETRGKGWENE